MIRGDSESLSFSFGETGTFLSGDKLVFTVKESYDSEEKLVSKNAVASSDTTNLVIDILPQDTEQLRLGSYEYDVRLYRGSGDGFVRKTIIEQSVFEIRPEVNNDGYSN